MRKYILGVILVLTFSHTLGAGTNTRVVGGTVVPQDDDTWRAIVALKKGSSQFCAGDLIAPKWVLTAAHCVNNMNSSRLTIGANSYNRNRTTHYSVAQIIVHENYNSNTNDNDIALIKLTDAVTGVTPIAYDTANSDRDAGTPTEVAGWGTTSEGGYGSDNLLEASVPLISRDTCNRSNAYNGKVTNNMLCAGYMSGGKDSCQGDSGGPLVFDNTLVGIVSWGNGCARPNRPGVYTNVKRYADWIANKIGNTETPGDTPPGDSTDTAVQAWNSTQIYHVGDIVSYKGQNYRAKWWTRGDIPGTQRWGPWELINKKASGNDDDSDENTSGNTRTGNDTWSADKIYTGGEVVIYNGKKYQAQWWTKGNIPGTEQWGPWKEVDDTVEVDEPDPDPLPTPTVDNGKISLKALQTKEAELTITPLMRLTKASIRTLDNSEVKQIVPKRADNPPNVKRVESIVKASDWNHLFIDRSKEYTYENFLKAVGKFPAFCGDYDDGKDAEMICRKSLATMFAHFTQETGGHNPSSNIPEWRQGLVYVREMGWTETMRNGYNAECNPDIWQGKRYPCGKFEDGSFKSYFGRGAKQLSYNYNYGAFSEAMTGDVHTLLDHPELVADTWYNLASAVFFFVYPQPPKPSMLFAIDGTWQPNESDKDNGLVPGFGVTTNIINGGVECGGSSEHRQSLNRIGYYREFSNYLQVPISDNEVLGCANMKQFTSKSSAALPIYWEEDWSWNPNNADGKSYSCKLVNYQTPYSALKEGDYVKCVEEKFSVTAE